MPKRVDIFVSILLIVDGHSVDVSERVKNVAKILKKHYSNYEIIVVDNGIDINNFKKLKNILTTTPCIRIIQLAKSSDIDTAIFAGVEVSIGDNICILYNEDPIEQIPNFIKENQENDIVFGIATNLKRTSFLEDIGAKLFYWYNRKYLGIDIPNGSTYFMSINRNAANALTKSGRHIRHVRFLANQVGFVVSHRDYELLNTDEPYTHTPKSKLISKAIDILANNSSHPLRVVS
jgi:hypothetical protein